MKQSRHTIQNAERKRRRRLNKKIASVKHKSVMKRFNEMRFAAGANRDYMEAIEFTGLSLDDLIDVALEEMGAIADTLGL